MNKKVSLPLNEPQQRRLAVTLTGLEKHLAELRAQLKRGRQDLRLTRYDETVRANDTVALCSAVRHAEVRLRKMADELGLAAQTQSERRTMVAALELANIDLEECRPGGGLKGCGAIAPPTADYLEREIPQLEAAVRQVLDCLADPTVGGEPPPHA